MGITKNAIRGLVIVVLSLLVVTAPAGAAGVVAIPDTTIYKNQWEFGTNPRYISGPTTSGWPVAFLKSDGPRMNMGAAQCWTTNLYDYGTLEDKDPPLVYEKVAVIPMYTTFCTAWKGLGNNNVDTFRGTLAWD